MKYLVVCDSKDNYCGCSIWIKGDYDYSTNALELNENDPNWNEACIHIQNGDYIIKDEEAIED